MVRVTDVEVLDGYQLRPAFDNGRRRIVEL